MRGEFAFAVKAVIIKDDKFLVLKRSKSEMDSSYINKHQCWDLPGGSVKYCETAIHALLREIEEETGLNISVGRILNVYDAIRTNIHMVIITYICTYLSGNVRLSNEHEAFYWLNIDEMRCKNLPDWMINNFKKALKEIQGKA